MTHWTETTSYSLQHDCDMARVSGFDDRCQEHFLMVEAGRGYRERREDALIRIQDWIDAGGLPGEVV